MQQRTPQSSGQSQTIAPARTRADVSALDIRRTELRHQLESNTERRSLLSSQLQEARGTPMQRDLEARIQALDVRTARIDQQLNQIDDAVNAALAQGISVDRGPQGGPQMPQMPAIQGMPGMPPIMSGREFKNTIARVMFFEGLGFVLLGLILWRFMRRRGPAPPVRLAAEETARLEQLQRNVDVIALEVERISEGQRYVAKLLSDKQSAIGAGAAQDISSRREPEPVRKRDA
jgi:hypothetical protein